MKIAIAAIVLIGSTFLIYFDILSVLAGFAWAGSACYLLFKLFNAIFKPKK